MQNTIKENLNLETILSLPTTKSELVQYYQECCKKSKKKIGLEYERISLDSRTYEVAEYKNIAEIIKNFAVIKGWQILADSNIIVGATDGFSTISLEPGGQFELSLEPKENLDQILEDVNYYTRLFDKLGDFNNVHFLPYGINPKSTYPNINIVGKKRYKLMADYMPKIGKLAPVMMRETAGVQVNLDYESSDDALFKLKVGAYISPFLTGFYANSPIRGGELTEYKSFRALAWKLTGFDRCNLFYKNLVNSRMGQDFEDYVDAIIDVPMLYIAREEGIVEINGKITFKEFMQNGYKGHWANLEDYKLHSSLCFPDVRLKNCIEFRNHDSQGILNTLSICALYKGIMYNKGACEDVLEFLKKLNHEDLETLGYHSAKHGLDFTVEKLNMSAFDVIQQLFRIARKGLPSNERDYLDSCIWLAQNNKCIADGILENKITDSMGLVDYLKRSAV